VKAMASTSKHPELRCFKVSPPLSIQQNSKSSHLISINASFPRYHSAVRNIDLVILVAKMSIRIVRLRGFP
jgi:hypothetical protein